MNGNWKCELEAIFAWLEVTQEVTQEVPRHSHQLGCWQFVVYSTLALVTLHRNSSVILSCWTQHGQSQAVESFTDLFAPCILLLGSLFCVSLFLFSAPSDYHFCSFSFFLHQSHAFHCFLLCYVLTISRQLLSRNWLVCWFISILLYMFIQFITV